MAGIKFRRNLKTELKSILLGEIVYATDTEEWGLGTSTGTVWRKHELLFKHMYFKGNGAPSNLISEIGAYYFDLSNYKVYQRKESVWVEIDYPISQTIIDANYLASGTVPNYADVSTVIKKDGSVKAVSGYEATLPKEAVTRLDTESLLGVLRQDGSTYMDDGYVGVNNGVVVRDQTVELSPPTSDPEVIGAIWNNNGKLVFSDGPVGVVRYFTSEPSLTFTWIGTVQATNGYVEVVSNSFPVMFDKQSTVTKIEIVKYGERTSWFRLANQCINLTEFIVSATDESKVTNFESAWADCASLTSFPLLDTSKVTNMLQTWYGCTGLTSFPSLDTSKVTNFGAAWQGCTGLTSFPLLDTSSGTEFSNAWFGCTSLTSFPLLDTSSATRMNQTWYGCSGLTSFPLLDTSKVIELADTWMGCNSLSSFPLLDTSSALNVKYAWNGCTSLTSFPLINTSKVTIFVASWAGCTGLTSFPSLDTSSGTNFGAAWAGCTSLLHCPAGNEVTIPLGAITTDMCFGI